MGLKYSKTKEIKSLEKQHKHPVTGINSESAEETCKESQDIIQFQKKLNLEKEDYYKIAEERMCEQLNSDISTFILNQLVLSAQFFKNFEIDKSTVMRRFTEKENSLNQKLDGYSIILANVLDGAVEEQVQFHSKYDKEKNQLYPLHLQNIFVVCEAVHISKPNDPNYDHIPPVCQVDIDTNSVTRSKRIRGYVRLKLKDNNNNSNNQSHLQNVYNLSTESSIDSVYESESVMESTYSTSKYPQKVYQRIQENNQDSPNVTSNYMSSCETDYEYIINLNTHQPLKRVTAYENRITPDIGYSILPQSCFSLIQLNYDYLNDSDSESEVKRIQMKYLNSNKFFLYFMELLQDRLASDLNISECELASATWKRTSVFTSQYEITPAIHITNWPDCAFEWSLRERKQHQHPITGNCVQWPTPEMIEKVKSFGCHVIPEGYIHKNKRNPYQEFEWKIVFPEAERYLELCLTNTQAKILMISKALIKTFVEPQERKGTYIFTMEYLRMHMFWECENNFLAWNEQFLGEALIRFLKSFIYQISRKSLPHYFIRDRNLIENIPDKYKSELITIFSHIVQNPVMYIMKTLRNLQHPYPKLNYIYLHKTIVADDILKFVRRIKTCVKNSRLNMEANENDENSSENVTENNNDSTEPEGFIALYNKMEKLDESKRRRTKKLKSSEVRKIRKRGARKNQKRISENSIDIRFIVPNSLDKIQRSARMNEVAIRSTTDRMRSVLITEIFTKHFIEMAKCMQKMKAHDQVSIYLSQARRLCTILFNSDYCNRDDAQTYSNEIKDLQNRLIATMKSSGNTIPPKLPKRTNSMQKKSENSSHYQNFASDKNVSFIEPRIFQTEADIHTPTIPNVSHKSNGILKESNSTMDYDSNSKVEVKNISIHRNQKKVRSITFAKDDDDMIEEARESTEL